MFESLFGFETLVAIGVCLVVLGLALRGYANGQKRHLANERQHQRLSGEPTAAPRTLNHFERHAANYARGAIALGVIASIAGFLRR